MTFRLMAPMRFPFQILGAAEAGFKLPEGPEGKISFELLRTKNLTFLWNLTTFLNRRRFRCIPEKGSDSLSFWPD